jgi:hypothetical protein
MKTINQMKEKIANKMFDGYMQDSKETMDEAFVMINTTATIFEANLDQFNRDVMKTYDEIKTKHFLKTQTKA